LVHESEGIGVQRKRRRRRRRRRRKRTQLPRVQQRPVNFDLWLSELQHGGSLFPVSLRFKSSNEKGGHGDDDDDDDDVEDDDDHHLDDLVDSRDQSSPKHLSRRFTFPSLDVNSI
jgi:hypothetical protein